MLDALKILFTSRGSEAKDSLTEAHDKFISMLDMAETMFTNIMPHLLEQTLSEDLYAEAKDLDQKSNHTERSLRKRLVEHLSFDTADAPACLVLMSVAKDGERMIDECLNLYQLSDIVKKEMPKNYLAKLNKKAEKLLRAIQNTIIAFAEHDSEMAVKVVGGEHSYIENLKEEYEPLLDDESITNREGIIIYRAFRAMQRIRAHLANIASAVIYPVHRIDFSRHKYLDQAKKELNIE